MKRRQQNLRSLLRESERKIILAALRANRGNKRDTADYLGISRSSLYRRIQALKIKLVAKRMRRGGRRYAG